MSNNISVLVADDEPGFKNALAFSFERKGYNVLKASNGIEAFDLITANSVDLVIADIKMPKGDGLQLLDKIKITYPNKPVILLSGGFDEVTTEVALSKGAHAVFSKPLDINTLIFAVESLLKLPKKWIGPSYVKAKDIQVQLRYQQDLEYTISNANCISGRGMFIKSDKTNLPNINDQLGYRILLNDSNNVIEGVGIVTWIKTHEAGDLAQGFCLEFSNLATDDKNTFAEFIKTNLLLDQTH